nr:type II secretion system protein [uncultured Cupriavidus sp.]
MTAHRTATSRRVLRARQAGFTLLWCLAMVAVTGIGMIKIGEVWQARVQREQEFLLRHVGAEIREAIRQYVENGDGSYPKTLDDLVEDRRTGQTRRWLRRAWRDPMTGADWRYLQAPGDGFLGVHSASETRPLKRDGFHAGEDHFSQATSYAAWRFAYWPGQPRQE